MPIAETTSTLSTVRDLIAVTDFTAEGELRDRFEAVTADSEELAGAAFELEVQSALEIAHRTLYSLYADRIWRAPATPRPAFAQSALDRVRANLEQGFCDYLTRRRGGELPDRPPRDTGLDEWFASLATGSHPHEDPAWSEFVREQISLDQLELIVANRSLFFLREPDPWLYAIPTLIGEAKAGLIDLMLDEYGWGKLDRMHSSVYARLMDALGLESSIDSFESAAEWQYLATLNHQWMLALTPEFSRRLLGTIYLTEADSPAAMTNYLRAWERLGIDDPAVLEFYEIHVSADENHRDVALHEVLMPVCRRTPSAATDIAIGIFDGRTVEAEFAATLAERFRAGITNGAA